METDSTAQMFISVLETMIGTMREMSDDGTDCSRVVILDETMINEIAEKLSLWWIDKHGEDGIVLTRKTAVEFTEEMYPETDENSRRCNNW